MAKQSEWELEEWKSKIIIKKTEREKKQWKNSGLGIQKVNMNNTPKAKRGEE